MKESFEKWEENKVNKSLSKFPERKETFKFDTDEEIKRLYTPLDGQEYRKLVDKF